MTNKCLTLALHGGAGRAAWPGLFARELVHMRGLIEAGRDRLRGRGFGPGRRGRDRRSNWRFPASIVAGRGASPNTSGRYELDAARDGGADANAQESVAALEGIRLADQGRPRMVMETTPHVMFVGEGAAALVAERQAVSTASSIRGQLVHPRRWRRREPQAATGPGDGHGRLRGARRDQRPGGRDLHGRHLRQAAGPGRRLSGAGGRSLGRSPRRGLLHRGPERCSSAPPPPPRSPIVCASPETPFPKRRRSGARRGQGARRRRRPDRHKRRRPGHPPLQLRRHETRRPAPRRIDRLRRVWQMIPSPLAGEGCLRSRRMRAFHRCETAGD